MRRVILFVFPFVVMLVHGLVWEQFTDPAGWPMLALSGAASAIPMAAIAMFTRRRKNVSESGRRAAVHFAATAAFLYTFALWVLPLLVEAAGRFGLIWLALVASEPLCIYPMLLLLERCAPVKRVALSP